jgi:glutamine amidotransferase
MISVAVVDTGLCNVDSMRRALEECGARVTVTADPSDLDHSDKLVLPGVGAFPDAIDVLEGRGLAEAIRSQVLDEGVALLGVCLGMQLLATKGFEGRETAGLDLIGGEVVRLEPDAADVRIPHVGWNEVDMLRDDPLLAGIPARADFYFVHSFHLRATVPGDVVATTPYCGGFTSIVRRGRVVGTQFHPEKSQGHGLRLLRNFVELAC